MSRTANAAFCDTAARASSFSVAALARRLVVWFNVAAERRALSGMSCARLDDLGLTDDQAWSEASRPFWDAPQRVR